MILYGITTTLRIESIDSDGNVTGLVDDDPISGFWDSDAQKLTFIRTLTSASPNSNRMQLFVGYQSLYENTSPQGCGGDECIGLAGYYIALADAGGSAQQSEFGWYAYIGLVT